MHELSSLKLIKYLPLAVACGLVGGYGGYAKEFTLAFFFLYLIINFTKYAATLSITELKIIIVLTLMPFFADLYIPTQRDYFFLTSYSSGEIVFFAKVLLTPIASIFLFKLGTKARLPNIDGVLYLSLIINLLLYSIGNFFNYSLALNYLPGAAESANRFFLVGIYIFTYYSIICFTDKKFYLSLMYLIPSVIAESKILIAAYVILALYHSTIRKLNFGRVVLAITVSLSALMLISDRLTQFYQTGDLYRFAEIINLNDYWSKDNIRLFIGSGVRENYRDLTEVDPFNSESDGFSINFNRTAHFTYYDLVFRYGLFGTLIYLWSMRKLLSHRQSLAYFYFLICCLSAPTLIYGPEALGFFYFIGVLSSRKNLLGNACKS